MPDGPAYRRLDVDARRAQLVALGERLFTSSSYSELSMARIAREAGISKALLYHYFPSKQAYFEATLQAAAEELRARTEPDASLPPVQQLERSLDVYLGWIEEHSEAYNKLIITAGEVAEVRALVEEVRAATAQRILGGVLGDGAPVPPGARTAVRGWLWFMDGACLDWIAHGDLTRDELRRLLIGTLVGALMASGDHELVAALTAS
ncbi:HTH-type transcriptional regulator BetI [Baekduia alba]|uniref:TetR/AcrR family transcriptional regulator n=1 Tax=Baekduia alba TaxID=2997333 RepID=UPI002342768E|nr:TetR/AcrR family transcriptional regulator [Baekduia alba]WCB96387.1 HTH-type transcriptional regulator BetI [Baekduia alba]